MTQRLSLEKLGKLFQAIDNQSTGKLSELAEIAGLNLSEDYIGADLSDEDLSGDDLVGANLSNTNLSNANLSNTNLSNANLSNANLSNANLSNTNLSNANLSNANLDGANLDGANLDGANLDGANLSSVSFEAVFQMLFHNLQESTKASKRNCYDVATRITAEVYRICNESKRIQASGTVENFAIILAKHRLQQCLRYYQLGSNQGRIELRSTLSAIIYRYINPPQKQSSYQGLLTIIEDFLQSFYLESLNAFRRESQLDSAYRPRTLLEFAEYMAFTERYGKRRISLPGRQQQLIILRAQSFSQQQPLDTSVDIEQASEGSANEADGSWAKMLV